MENQKTILIVEDERILSEMYNDKFTQAGFNVMLADSAESGIKTILKIKPDLILLDILLPRNNGICLLKYFKERNLSLPPILAFSNFDDPKIRKEALDLGVLEYLLKTDFTPQNLIEKVREYLYANQQNN
ncbi:MAG: response regulator [Candidatus Pacebacteria bacterium]|nr:response regulator [Candidatus Paceibacterota bacterium]